MANSVCEVLLTDVAILPAKIAGSAETGAIVDFWGVVRKTEDCREINGIEYEAHRSMAEHQLRMIAEEAATRFHLLHVSITHRVGFVPIGEPSLLVRVQSGHRAEAFTASISIVDELKKRAPIWKHPRFAAAHARQTGNPQLASTSA